MCYIGQECSKLCPDILSQVSHALYQVCEREHCHSITLMLCTTKGKCRTLKKLVDCEDRPGNNFIIPILSLIFVLDKHTKYFVIQILPCGLGIQSRSKHMITCRYLKQIYIGSIQISTNNMMQFEYIWCPHICQETSKIQPSYTKKGSQNWPQQHKEAMEDEVKQAVGGSKKFSDHCFRQNTGNTILKSWS